MAEQIKEEWGIDARLIRGGKGIYDVVVDGVMVYSKYETGRHAEEGEVLEIIKQLR